MAPSPMKSSVTVGREITPSGYPLVWIQIDVDPLVRLGGFLSGPLDKPAKLPGRPINGGRVLLTSMERDPAELISILETAVRRLRALGAK